MMAVGVPFPHPDNLTRVGIAMARKGRVQVGATADLVAFDPDKVTDRSAYDAPHARSTGVEHVLVAGEPVVRDGSLVDSATPGHPVGWGAR
jgi:N-acyl-D-aspartate/D-glutamate deacylase